MLPCTKQGGADGQVLWLLQQCQPGKPKKNSDELIPSVLELDESSKERRKNWAKLIQVIYEVDPLTCPKCSGKMKVISLIEDEEIIKKIFKHLGLWEVKPRPPPTATRPTKMAEYSIDYSTSQLPASDKWLYVDPPASDPGQSRNTPLNSPPDSRRDIRH
jgi:hypothetical protein